MLKLPHKQLIQEGSPHGCYNTGYEVSPIINQLCMLINMVFLRLPASIKSIGNISISGRTVTMALGALFSIVPDAPHHHPHQHTSQEFKAIIIFHRLPPCYIMRLGNHIHCSIGGFLLKAKAA